MALHHAGHAVLCLGDDAIATEFSSAKIPVEAVQLEATLDTFMARWRIAQYAGPAPFRPWADACLTMIRELVRDFDPQLLLSEIFTGELARITKRACGIPWCCINPGYYFGWDSIRSPETDYVGRSWHYRQQFIETMGDADLVLHGTDAVFDPPPSSLPSHHVYVGPLWWERSDEVPSYLDAPGAPWVLLTVSSAPQAEEMTLVRTALRALAAYPVRVLLTLSERHKVEEIGIVPPNARIERFVPHAAVLARSRLLLSHAGHGIVMKALYYGVPMVLVPWDRDQPGVAARAAALGAADVVMRHELTEVRLSTAIERVLGDPSYQQHATRISGRLRARDPVVAARTRIEEFLAISDHTRGRLRPESA
jgi:UDP-glucoronosyl and UDP-glucosyl transferase